MTKERLLARKAIEALRSGIATPSVVSTLGTSQADIEHRVLADLDSCAGGSEVRPLVVVGGFGSGKTHMLNYIAATAIGKGFVTSHVVASPETPPGNLHVVLKAVAETARAPGHTGRALQELMAKYDAKSAGFAKVRSWAAETEDIHDRFRAMLHLYEVSSDAGFQSRILSDLQGHPMTKTEIKTGLKEIGQLQGYDLSHPRNQHLAPQRIRLLAQLFRACDCNGWVVMFDELERIAYFPRKQRIQAYSVIGWWARQAQQGLGIYPVFAFAPGAIDEVWWKHEDHRYLDTVVQTSLFQESEDYAAAGLDLLARHRMELREPDLDQRQRIHYALRELYSLAYEWKPAQPPDTPRAASFVSVRSEIRGWVTELDLKRHYGSAGEIVDEGLIMDTRELSEEQIATDDDGQGSAE